MKVQVYLLTDPRFWYRVGADSVRVSASNNHDKHTCMQAVQFQQGLCLGTRFFA